MTSATIQLIEAVERLNMTGEIGDGMVARLHELATMARVEITPLPDQYCKGCECVLARYLGGLERHHGDCEFFPL